MEEIEHLKMRLADKDHGLELLRAENAKLQELLRGVGANRYWEERWRDVEAENAKLRAKIDELSAIIRGEQNGKEFINELVKDVQ